MGDVATARPLTASQQLRKVRKPLIERKRRERINGCLNELKSLVLESLNKDEAQFSKLEKADILELALEVLKKKNTQKVAAPTPPEPSVIASKYTAGFSQCALEVARCLGTIEGVKPEVRVHLTEHLAGCVQKLAKLANRVGAGNVQNKEEVSLDKVLPNSPSPVSFLSSPQSPSSCSETSSTDRSSPASTVSSPMTSPLPVYPAQQLRLVGHVVTSSPEHVQLVQTIQQQQQQEPMQQQQQSFPVIHLSPVQTNPQVQQQQQSPVLLCPQQIAVNPQRQIDCTANVEVRRVLPSSHVFKPHPVSACSGIQVVPAQNVWRPW